MSVKKIIIFILICALTIVLCGCHHYVTKTYPEGVESKFGEYFIKIKEITSGNINDENVYFIYDKNTKIIYLYTCGGYHATMCPYYIINENNEPTIAIYGVNYEVD